jgi:hypothetical protein
MRLTRIVCPSEFSSIETGALCGGLIVDVLVSTDVVVVPTEVTVKGDVNAVVPTPCLHPAQRTTRVNKRGTVIFSMDFIFKFKIIHLDKYLIP